MATIVNTGHKIFNQDEAAKLATQLTQDNEDGWKYVSVNNPNPDGPKTAIIKIYDETGEFVALL